jgi:hypothetical protein
MTSIRTNREHKVQPRSARPPLDHNFYLERSFRERIEPVHWNGAGFERPRALAGVFLWRQDMDREDSFPPHIIGFMKRKREKEKLDYAKALRIASPRDEP